MKVVLATSVPPKISRSLPNGVEIGTTYQQMCIDSWAEANLDVVSLNPEHELHLLDTLYNNLKTKSVSHTASAIYKRPLIWLTDIMNYLASVDSDVVGIINSDILVRLPQIEVQAALELARTHIVAFNRTEITFPMQSTGPLYRYGFDLYLLPKAMAYSLKMNGFALGAPWWDYCLLLMAKLQGIPVAIVQGDGARHLTHGNNWNTYSWEIGASLVAKLIRTYVRENKNPYSDSLLSPEIGVLYDIVDCFVGSLRFDAGANYLGREINYGVGTLLGIQAVRTIERGAVRFRDETNAF